MYLKDQHTRALAATLRELKYYKAFLASDPGAFAECKDPRCPFKGTLTRSEASRRLWFLIEAAINRKGGLPPKGRRLEPLFQTELARDAAQVRDMARSRPPIRQFTTDLFRRRLSHLITPYEAF